MLLNLSKNLSKANFLNFLFFLLPASFIAGNLILNLNIFLIIVSGLIFFNKNILKFKVHLIDKIVFLFFFFVLFTGIINNIHSYITDELRENFVITIKSLLYLRFLLLYIIIRYLVEKNLFNFKFFFISSFIFSLFVSLDIYYQFVFGQDIFGYKGFSRKLSGPFGDEYIAGGYIQRFSFFGLFLLPIFFKIKNKYFLISLIFFLTLIYFSTIVLSGNRMPLLLFLLSIFLFFILEKEIRKFLFPLLAIFLIIFITTLKFNKNVYANFSNFYVNIKKMASIIVSDSSEVGNPGNLSHFKEFESFYETWLMNKYIGGGIKTFRSNCHNRKNLKVYVDPTSGYKFICSNHPHNYYLEILTELGMVGFLILIVIFFKTLFLSFKKKIQISKNYKNNYLISPFIVVFFIEIFPLKSTGGFFSTWNATFIFLILSFTIALSLNKN